MYTPTIDEWKDARTYYALEKCKSNLQWSVTSHRSEQQSPKNLQTIDARKGVAKKEPLYTIGENVSWYNHYGVVWRFL